LDLGRYELRRGSDIIKLEKNPMEALILLAEKNGQLVTRAEIIQKLWGDNVFVDTRHGINTAIHKLRAALDDDPDNPRIIQTVVGKGYRLIGPVETTGENAVEPDSLNEAKNSPVPDFLLRVGTIQLRHLKSENRWKALPPLILAVLVGAAGVFYFANDNRSRINSVAVLPFSNASGDPSMEYLSDGITEGVIDKLSGLPNIKVISRTSAFHYKQREIEPQKAAKELGVDALVMGRVVRRGNDLTVSAELVDAREDKQLWGEQYSRTTADIGSVQREIATAISGNLRVRLTSEEKTRLVKSAATNPEAYQLYLKGRYHANQTTAAEVKKGIDYFQQAIEKDPGYALAYAGLADSYSTLGGGWVYLPPIDSFPKAKAAAMKALEIDDTLAEAHAALAYVVYYADWDWPRAEREFKRAIELNPNSALAHDRYAKCLNTRLRFKESMSEAQRAQELDPLSPEIVSELGSVLLLARRYDESIAQFQKALDLNPNLPVVRALLAWAYAMKAMYPQALTEYDKIPDQDKAVAAENQLVAGGLGWVYAVSGRRADALKIAKEFRDLSSHAYVDFYMSAGIYAGLGDKDEAFRLLEKGYAEHSATMPWLGIDPFWYGMRSDPRYADLLRRMGLPQ